MGGIIRETVSSAAAARCRIAAPSAPFSPVALFQEKSVQSLSCLLMLALAGTTFCIPAQAACTTPVLVSPEQIEISEASPRIEWTPVGDAQHYLVWLESRVPEGRVLQTEAFQTGEIFWTPPRPLTTGKAVVRLRVTAVCKDATQAVLSARFRIVEDKACSLQASPVVEPVPGNGQWNVRWEPLRIAQQYEIRAHATVDGKPVFTRDSKASETKIDRLKQGVWLLAVQPVCAGLRGVTSWVVVSSLSDFPRETR